MARCVLGIHGRRAYVVDRKGSMVQQANRERHGQPDTRRCYFEQMVSTSGPICDAGTSAAKLSAASASRGRRDADEPCYNNTIP